MESIASWLGRLGLERYAAVFAENDIDVDVMPSLTEHDLEKLGVSMGHRKRMLAAATAAAPTGSVPVVPLDAPAAVGALLEPGERRQLTVMFCDLVGSTALSERLDPEDLQEVLGAYQRCAASVIETFDGHIAQYLGDGLLVYFGHPRAHEDDAERAVHAAMGIVAEMHQLCSRPPFAGDMQLAVRIGIHTGLIVIGDVGGTSRREQLALGDTPNIAARLQGLASPDAIVVSEGTRRLVAGRFEFADMGLTPLKGIRDPVRAWRVEGVSVATSRFEAATHTGMSAFIGREEESALIVDRWESARVGHGQVIQLSGEPGIGKSRIIEEARWHLGEAGARALRFQCSPYHMTSAFHPVTHGLESLLQFARSDSPIQQLDRLDAFVIDALGCPVLDAGLLASMLSIPSGTRYDLSAVPALRQKQETIRAFVHLIEAIARKTPTLLLFEDVHWADPTSLELLGELVMRTASMPLLVILTFRPEFSSSWNEVAHVSTRALSRLTHADSAALVARVTNGKPLPAGLTDEITNKADGVPLFVEELTKFFLESGRLVESDGGYEYSTTAVQTAVPATLRDSLMARLDRIASVKDIAQIGATIGREFSHEMISHVAGMSATRLDAALASLTEAGLAVRHREPPDAAYMFKHALVQDVAYESMRKSRRQDLHRTIVRVIEDRYPGLRATEPELLAHHSSAAGLVEEAIPYWREAATRSVRRMALAEATSQLSRGLELVVSLPASVLRDRTELPFHAMLGTAHMLSKGWGADEVARAYRRANELSRSVADVEETVWPLWGVCVFHLVRGEMTRALEIAERISAVAESTGGRTTKLVAHMIQAQVHMYSGRFADARRRVALAVGIYREQEHRSLIGLYTTDLLLTVRVHEAHLLWLIGRPDQAAALCEKNERFAQSLDHPYSMSWALTWGAIPLLYRGDIARLLSKTARGIAIAEEFGFAYTAAIGRMAHGWGVAQQGALSLGIDEMRLGLAAFKATGSAIVLPFFQTMLAELLGRVGQPAEGIRLLDDAMAQVTAWEERWQEPEIHRVRGVLMALEAPGVPRVGEASLRQALLVAERLQAPGWQLRAALQLAYHLHEQGEHVEAEAVLAPVHSTFSEGLDTADLRDADALLASITRSLLPPA